MIDQVMPVLWNKDKTFIAPNVYSLVLFFISSKACSYSKQWLMGGHLPRSRAIVNIEISWIRSPDERMKLCVVDKGQISLHGWYSIIHQHRTTVNTVMMETSLNTQTPEI